MTCKEIAVEVKSLGLPQGSYVVCGSCPLAVLGIREANDIDLLVTPEVLQNLKFAGWEQVNKGPNDAPYTSGVFEAHANRDFSTYRPTLEELLATATVVDGVPFASLHHVRRWKVVSDRPKDLADVKLIDEYIAKHSTDSDSNAVVATWTVYTDSIADWQKLIADVIPKATACGPIYELPNPIDRPNESFAIADMRELNYSEPHYHINGETEIYIALTGTGRVFVGGTESQLQPGTVVITPPDTTHFVIPTDNLVLAVINTPPFNAANTVPISKTDLHVRFNQEYFAQLVRSLH